MFLGRKEARDGGDSVISNTLVSYQYADAEASRWLHVKEKATCSQAKVLQSSFLALNNATLRIRSRLFSYRWG